MIWAKKVALNSTAICTALAFNTLFLKILKKERTGCRPNDVYFSLMIFAKDHHIKIEQSISGVQVYDFPDIEYLYSENQDNSHFFNFNETEEILFQAIQDFLNNR